ncbi:PEGA domain-containing protein [Rubrivirga sp. S365]|uniref:PEGA domain-containing protein n=1 Tax=Rubrivirga litoralis TaxID=3075598 RepID=A0ABU3BQB5_9BACT|nr:MULTISPECIES: PEGA domain-containing protein [unclassified Rubrivirga]MDT0631487.1 PEGA domain-containing protein [Rubrivirga sp. F394]MDT7855530.1 PEGA domain-containing protein [Rubrivirga sp. S365]
MPPTPSPPPRPWTPEPETWTPEPADVARGNARTVVFRMVAAMAVVVVLGVGLLVADWYTSRTPAADVGYEAAPPSVSNGGGVDGEDGAESGLNEGGAGEAVLEVDSAVEGASVFVNGDSVGTTPLRLSLSEPGPKRVLVARGARALLDTTVQVEYGRVAVFAAGRRDEPAGRPTAAEAERGSIRVTSTPAGAAVLLDGRRVGQTPVTVDGLTPGEYALAVQQPGYEPATRRVTLRPGTRYETALELRSTSSPTSGPAPPQARPTPAPPRPDPGVGTVEILVRPWGRIEIDGQLRQRESDVVYRTELPTGTHRIRVSHPTLGSQERDVVVNRGVTYRVDIDLGGSD